MAFQLIPQECVSERMVGQIVRNVKDRSTKGEAAMGYRETEIRQCAKIEKHLFIDPEDVEFKENMKKRAEDLEMSMEATMFCKVKNHPYSETSGKSDNRKSKHACIVKAHESTRKRLERTLPKDHEDRFA